MGKNYADMDDYVRRLDRDRVRLITKLKVRAPVRVWSFETGSAMRQVHYCRLKQHRHVRHGTSFRTHLGQHDV